jgi:hypothetical protein
VTAFRTEIVQAASLAELDRELNTAAADGWLPLSVSVYDAAHPEVPAWYLVLYREAR